MEEREFELINIIGRTLGANQRILSRQMNLSLGMTNMLIRRLVTKGYIRIRQLNKRKIEYLLTSKGFTEKMHKSVKYTLKTINSIGLIKRSLSGVLQRVKAQGVQKAYILGGVDVAGLIEMVVREEFGETFKTVQVETILPSMKDGIILVCRENVSADALKDYNSMNVLEELAKNQSLVASNLL